VRPRARVPNHWERDAAFACSLSRTREQRFIGLNRHRSVH
jgi:hypothetical protein